MQIRQMTQGPRRGVAIFAVIIGMLVLSALSMTALEIGLQESRSARATRVSAAALYTAEAGVAAVRAAWPTAGIAAGDSLDLGWTALGSGGRYRAWIHRRDDAATRMQIYSLTVEGSSPGPLGGRTAVQVWATRFLNSLFSAAVSARGNVNLDSNNPATIVDSFDSRLGDYGAPLAGGGTNVEYSGSVLANGSVTISGTAEIRGNATVSGSVSDPTRVTGTVTEGAPPAPYPVELCPPWATMPGVSVNQGNKWHVKIENTTYTAAAGTYSVHDFRMLGGTGGHLVIPPGTAVKVYVSGTVDIGGSSTLNNQGKDPMALSFVSCIRGNAENQSQWNLHGGSDAYFTVYAPSNNIVLSGNSPVYGAIIANNLSANGGSSIHFDRALAESNSLSSVMPRSWRQLLR